MKHEECPCYQCICTPVCCHKQFTKLLRDCKLLDYFYNNEGYNETIAEFSIRYNILIDCLKPEWAEKYTYKPKRRSI